MKSTSEALILRNVKMSRLVQQTETEIPLEAVGGKAKGLLKLKSLEDKLNDIWFHHRETEITIPPFFVIPADLDLKKGYKDIINSAEKLKTESYVVRSSSVLEDVGENSFDGIFDTKLNVSKWKLLREIYNVRKSATSQKARDYSKDVGVGLDGKMPVVVQKMINKANETGIIYSKFPCPNDIIKVIRNYSDEKDIISFLREHDKNKILLGEPTIPSKHGEYATEESKDLAMISLEVENELGYPVIIEFNSNTDYGRGDKKEIYLLQARKLTKLSEAEKFQMPELQEKGLIATTYSLNSVGDFTGEAFCIGDIGMVGGARTRGIKGFDERHKEKGYVLVTPFLELNNQSIDYLSPNKKAIVTYGDLGKHHDFEIARKKGLLYLNCKDCLHMGFFNSIKDNKKAPIKTGEKVRVVSDGERGFVFNLSR